MGVRRMQACEGCIDLRQALGRHQIGVLRDRTVGEFNLLAVEFLDKGPAHARQAAGGGIVPQVPLPWPCGPLKATYACGQRLQGLGENGSCMFWSTACGCFSMSR